MQTFGASTESLSWANTGGDNRKEYVLLSVQGAILFLGFCYGVYLVGAFIKELTNDFKESFAIWNAERKERV